MPETAPEAPEISPGETPEREPDFDRDIHVARRVNPITPASDIRSTRGSGLMVFFGYAIVGTIAFAGLNLVAVLRFAGVPSRAQTLILVLVGGGVGAVLSWWGLRAAYRAYCRSIKFEPGKNVSDARYRLRFVGSDEALASLGPIEQTGFDPEVFFSFGAAPLSRKQIWVWVICSGLAFGIGWPIYGYLGLPGMRMNFVAYCISVTAGLLPAALLWPTYVRIAPGRLDVLEYSGLSRRPPRVTTYDLRTVRVQARTAGIVRLDPPSGDLPDDHPLKDFAVQFMATWPPHRKRFVSAVLRSAVSTAPTPPLPDDMLVG